MTCFRWLPLPLPCHLTFSMNSLEKKWKGNRRNPIRYKIRNFFDLCNLGFFLCKKWPKNSTCNKKKSLFFAHAIPRQWVQKRKHRLFYLLNIGAQMRWWQKPSSTGGRKAQWLAFLLCTQWPRVQLSTFLKIIKCCRDFLMALLRSVDRGLIMSIKPI